MALGWLWVGVRDDRRFQDARHRPSSAQQFHNRQKSSPSLSDVSLVRSSRIEVCCSLLVS